MSPLRPVRLAAAVAAAALLAGCDGGGEHAGHGAGEGAGHAHVHEAPHGGTLVVLAEESVNLEILHDAAAGTLTAWVLDGHAERGVRISQRGIDVSARRGAGAAAFDVTLVAVGNALTGETPGDTSEFAAADERLRGPGPVEGTLRSVTVKGAAFTEVEFRTAGEAR